jgi:hypothetical protein
VAAGCAERAAAESYKSLARFTLIINRSESRERERRNPQAASAKSRNYDCGKSATRRLPMRFKPPAMLALAVLLALAAFAPPARAQAANPNARTIEVTGSGETRAAPDYAALSLAIETRGGSAEQAAGRNAALAQKVVDALKSKLRDKGKISTGGYNLYPEYNQPRDGEKPTITGYVASNSIIVETGAFTLIGALIDSAIAAGANRINSLDFTLRDDTKARAEAIAHAAHDAQVQATALATALGVKLGPIIKASTEAQVRPVPMLGPMALSAMARSVSTPVQPGEVTVPATVSLAYEIQ